MIYSQADKVVKGFWWFCLETRIRKGKNHVANRKLTIHCKHTQKIEWFQYGNTCSSN